MSKIETGKYTKYLKFLIPALFWIILVLTSKDFLLRIEGRSIFLFDWFWIKDFTDTPAGILNCAALFLTQFLHLPWVGSFIWVLLLAISAYSTARLYGIPESRSALAWIPAFILAGANMSIGYLIYIMNTPGYFFAPVLGYLLILSTVALSRKFKSTALLAVFIAVCGFAGFLIAGYYAFAAIAAAALDHLVSDKGKGRFVPLITAIAAIIISPIALYGLTTYNLSQGWIQGLPATLYQETHLRTFFPVIAATVIPCILPFTSRFTGSKPSKPALFQAPVLAVCAVLLYLSWFRDTNYWAETSMIEAVNRMDWQKTIGIMKDLNGKADKDPEYQPTRVMVLLKDLALIKTGQEGQSAFAFDDGDADQKNSHEIPMVLEIGKILYLHYGIPGFCHRWSMEEAGEFGWSPDALKYLTMASVSMNDGKLAAKYLDILDNTLFYRNWSAQQRKLCNDTQLAARTAPYDMIMPLVCYPDELGDDRRGCEYTLTRHFTGARPDNATQLYDRVSLFWSLKSQNDKVFWAKFLLYLEYSDISKMERHYQEAAYLFSHIANNRTLMSLPYDKTTQQLYDSFVNSAQKHEFDIESLKDARRVMPSHLRYTYYYYYSFVRGLKQF